MLALARGWVQVVGQARRAGLIGRHDHEINDRNQRLAKDFENLAETLATLVTLASVRLGLRGARQGVGVNSTNRRLVMHDNEGRQIGS